jgi:hypothetical protein
LVALSSLAAFGELETVLGFSSQERAAAAGAWISVAEMAEMAQVLALEGRCCWQ